MCTKEEKLGKWLFNGMNGESYNLEIGLDVEQKWEVKL